MLAPDVLPLGRDRVVAVTERPGVPAADPGIDALFTARAALKRAYGVRAAAELQVEQLRALVARLEAERKATA